ncbi:hypothetical protein ASG01_07730 [Chryseobacterium sp. Leaf180]|uniref:hypothetical protein n=1 Tax=Chryseobacterium sp. Leaf180 TaxID=1736289 RepID=UPI0006F3B59E|nr:hypothetical protein [Chryseobacterium sp. Leaf180]KQR93744.1 hypothetical protein ASG01_07730 [Chryseobacterium sp. Leaf180]
MTQKQKTTIIYGVPAAILCIPLIGNLTSKEFDWSLSDFVIGAALLFGTAFIIDMILRKVKSKTSRIIFSCVIVFLLILIWVEMAVGLFGSPISGS